jgi:RNA polymerase sigma-70 factor, ECF subfamily
VTEDEFLPIYRAHLPRILRYCAFRLGSRPDAEDVAAETFARLLSHGGPSSGERTSAWLFAVARNLCADHERRARRASAMPSEDTRDAADEPVWIDIDVGTAIRALSPGQQQVLFLRAIEDMTFEDIGRLVGRTESAVKMQYHRAVRRTRRSLEEVESCQVTSPQTP